MYKLFREWEIDSLLYSEPSPEIKEVIERMYENVGKIIDLKTDVRNLFPPELRPFIGVDVKEVDDPETGETSINLRPYIDKVRLVSFLIPDDDLDT